MNQLDLLDEIILLNDGKRRTLDCILVLELDQVPSLEYLKDGALRAQETFPKTAKHEVAINNESNLEEFVSRPLRSIWHIEQARIGNQLALKINHALGDGVSMFLWIKAQFGEKIPNKEISLHEFKSKKNTPYKHFLNSEKWPLSHSVTNERKSYKLTLSHKQSYGEFYLNDILSLAVLKSIPVKTKGLWIPVNVRKSPLEGFGNGLSRMRIYPSKTKLSLKEELAHIKKQKKEAWRNGEIFLPPSDFDLSSPLKRSLLKMWVNRPWADWASLSFSHVHAKENFLPAAIKAVWGITNISDKQNAALFAYTKGTETFLTLNVDRSADGPELEQFLEKLQENFHTITGEL